MIENLRGLAVFAKTVECGSFRKAAAELNLSPSVVSHHISSLEKQLGVALLYRSTRQLSLTRDGEKLVGPAQAMMKSAVAGINSVLRRDGELSGELKVTAPALLAHSRLADRIAEFISENPYVKLEIDYSELPRDIIAEGIDVAVRAGWLRDSQLKARKLYTEDRAVLASSEYLSSKPIPRHPSDIEDWDWLDLAPVTLRPVFTSAKAEKVTIKPDARLSANNASALYNLTLRGAGIAVLPLFLARSDLENGAVQIVLPDWKLAALGVYAVRPHNSPKDSIAGEFVKAISHA